MSLQGRKVGAKSSKKQDIEQTANKLRAIKQRQGQWLREREEAKALTSSKSVESLTSRGKAKSTRSSSISELSSNAEIRGGSSRDLYSNPRRKPLYTPPKRDHSNVITWSATKGESVGKLGRPPSGQRKQPPASKVANVDSGYANSKSQRTKEKTYEPSHYSSSNDYTSKEFDGLGLKNELQKSSFLTESENNVVDEERNSHVDKQSFGHNIKTNKYEQIDERPARDSSFSNDISPDMIDALAETVARKLKTRNHSGNNSRRFRETVDNQEDELEMSTHMCPLCRSLMSGSRHTPMALIPCGHSLCKECTSECTKCPTCQSRTKSSAVNTVLQQIISDVLAQKEQNRLEKLEQETRKYVDEYQSLSLRSNALAGIVNVMCHINLYLTMYYSAANATAWNHILFINQSMHFQFNWSFMLKGKPYVLIHVMWPLLN